ncbi:MAG: DUF5615 family PIN-like protein [Bacteroidia bacterium]
MKFVVDESVESEIAYALRKNNHDVIYIAEGNSGIKDLWIIQEAFKLKYILITQDKDFGELVYRLSENHSGIILIRLHGLLPSQKTDLVLKLINDYEEEILDSSFIVLQKRLVRVRPK